MGFLDRLYSDSTKRYPNAGQNGSTQTQRMPSGINAPQPPGRFSFGTQTQGGPVWSDPFRSRPSPSLVQLVENYGQILYAMVARNRDAVSRLPMRLMADGSRVQGGPPGRACDPIRVSRRIGERLARAGQISSAAVDQVYEIRNHPLLDTIKKPDPYGNFTREQFIGLICSYMDVVGSAYLVPEGRGWDWKDTNARAKGPPEFLWVIYPQYTIPIRLSASPIVDHFMYFADWIPRSSTIWFRHNHSLRDAYGSAFSPTNAGEPYRKQEQEQVAILSQVLGIGPRPNMIASAKDPMYAPGKKEKEAFEIDLVNKHAAGYAGGILVTTGAFDWTPVSYSPADLGGNEIAKQDIYNMAAIFGQPATYYTVDSNLANLQAADEHHAKFGVTPRCNTIAAVFTELAQSFDDRLFFQFDDALPEDDKLKAETEKIYVDMGAMTINQLNQDKKLPAVPWGNEPLFPKTMQTWTMMQEAHKQSMEQANVAMQSQGAKDEIAVGSHGMAQDAHEHGKEMDKAKLELESKQRETRALEVIEELTRSMSEEIELLRKGSGNQHHVPSGPHGGEFASGGGSGGSAHQKSPYEHGKHYVKRQRQKAKKQAELANKTGAGGGGGKPSAKREHSPSAKAALDRVKKGKPVDYKSDKARKAAESAGPTDAEVQRYTKANEFTLAKKIGGQAFPDNGPVDVTKTLDDKKHHGVELKTLIYGKNDKVTMAVKPKSYEDKSAIERKVDFQNEHNTTVHTVIDDHRDRFRGGENKHLYSGNALYYKRGTGSFRLGSMHPVKDHAHLVELMNTPYDKLPAKAKGDRRGGLT